MPKFDSEVQVLKYKVLKEVAIDAWKGALPDTAIDIPKRILPGKKPTFRCCVYKERAILAERVKIAMGHSQNASRNVVEVIDIACDECPAAGYEVTASCRGCIAHRCMEACRKDAIFFDHNRTAHIDKSKCVNCGLCAKSCPYSAITNHKRPCQNACKVKAISIGEDDAAVIDDSKCISCGACVYQCPFGAIQDKSFITNVIDLINKSEGNTKYKVYATVAPSISSQFTEAKLGQVVTAIKALGFYSVIEVALGADMVAHKEAQELAEKGFLTSSCCPAFVKFIENTYPSLKDKVSSNLSPMAELGSYIKQNDPEAKVIFIGPCIAKKMEFQKESVKPYVDSVITFEELLALFDSKNIELTALDETPLDNASYFGRIFARSGGLSDAVKESIKEQGLDFEVNAIACSGIDECRNALTLKNRNVLQQNFIEGMACVDGCIGGAGCITHGFRDKAQVDKYGKEALEKSIEDAISQMK